MTITRKAYAKINLGLDVTGKRPDGYHLVRMIMQNIDLYDTLTFEENETGKIRLFCDTEGIPTDDSNLICKAAAQLREEFGVTGGADITLKKRIPAAAGMAGGSTDGAATYLALSKLWGLEISKEKLCELAVKKGADIPYCIMGGTMLSEGIGEILTPIKDMPDCTILIAKPAIGVSTAWVYTELDSAPIADHPDIDGVRAAIEAGNLRGMCDKIGNVLETVTVKKHGIIRDIEKLIEDNGAIRAFMTGSGPTVFGIFDDRDKAQTAYDAVRDSGLAPELFLTRPINPANEE